MNQHTLGPWIADDVFVYAENGARIADCDCDEQDMSDETVYANAALIATAPEMLDALKLLQDVKGPVTFADGWATLEDGTEICLNELIAQAEGKELDAQ